jgi:hypothetical protein
MRQLIPFLPPRPKNKVSLASPMHLPSVFCSTLQYVSHPSAFLEHFTIEFYLPHILPYQQLDINSSQIELPAVNGPERWPAILRMAALQPTAWKSFTHLNRVQCPLQHPSCGNTKQPAEAIIGSVQKSA